jgi:hypothetical protein
MAAVERKMLLSLLQRQAADEGVDVRFAAEADVDAVLGAGYDLVVVALRADIAARRARGWPAAGSGRPAPAKTPHPRSSGGNQGDQPVERNDQRRFRQP